MLDYLWLSERLRRWGLTGERAGIVSPLLTTEFVRAAFAMSPEQRLGNELHRALLRRMLPAWADVPFFAPPAAASGAATVARLGASTDGDRHEQMVRDASGWADDFLPAEVRALWRLSVAGRSTRAQEVTLSRVVWRAAFDQHLDGLPLPRARPPATAPGPVSRPSSVRSRALAAARRLPALRRLARTGPGQAVLSSKAARRLFGR